MGWFSGSHRSTHGFWYLGIVDIWAPSDLYRVLEILHGRHNPPAPLTAEDTRAMHYAREEEQHCSTASKMLRLHHVYFGWSQSTYNARDMLVQRSFP